MPLTIASPPDVEVMALSTRWLVGFVDDAVAQNSDTFGLDLDDIAGLQIARRIEPRPGAGRRAGDDDIAWHQRREGRDVVDEVAEAEDQPRGAVVLPDFAADARGQADIGDLRLTGVGHDPGPEAAGGIEILALGDVEFGVADPVADGALVAQRDGRDVVERGTLRNVATGLADD